MGSVQSGKTASMLGVAAKGLDAGVDAIVLLGGTQVGLWKQTFDRTHSQLDLQTSVLGRVLMPSPSALLGQDGYTGTPADLYQLNVAAAKRAVAKSRPILVVALKNVHHLGSLATTISESIMAGVRSADRPFHLLVLDDEADDGSINDPGPLGTAARQLPDSIVDLWDSRPRSHGTSDKGLFVTYMAYTATPQANFLQRRTNPLAPNEFVVSLRTPGQAGELTPRSATYREPQGPSGHYVGGQLFYKSLTRAPLFEARGPADDSLADAVRAFLVAGAIRLWRRGSRLLPSQAQSMTWTDAIAAKAQSPLPHSMLFHPSASMEDHFDGAARLLAWAHDEPVEASRARINAGERHLPVEQVTHDLESNENQWSTWVSKFADTGSELEEVLGPLGYAVAQPSNWPEIKTLIIDEVLPAVRIAVVNSDPASDDRPRFDPVRGEDGWRCSPNLLTIFVAGNVMSRGLTLEGLTTTLFLRPSDNPVADTQTQMQRWFGYRGAHLDVVRLFAEQKQIDLFRAYHDADEALRRQVFIEMSKQAGAPNPIVLETEQYRATNKIADVRSVPAWPGADPFIELVNDGGLPDPNTQLVVSLFADQPSHVVDVSGPRGRMLDKSLDLQEAADLLDALRYDHYTPSPEGWQASRWGAIESHLFSDDSSPQDLRPFFRTPANAGESIDFARERTRCPYSVAAYLRLWASCLDIRSDFFTTTGELSEVWSMVDLEEKRNQQPRFNIGIRFGSGAAPSTPPFDTLAFDCPVMNRAVRDGEMPGGWGSHNAGPWAGDEWFDLYDLDHPPSETELQLKSRAAGRPGLILFNITHPDGIRHPVTAVGVSLPVGGPNQIAARGPAS
ncbi:Z1 domain-containing protein [Aeromicrobium stalagmiti]|uniref:Z1 domain-containing protein n=1 Tax=Aeromicrobium stalagmiti TaxID=2738988 RepID=UPI0015699112|nr:Z1 domain-containing protein [Aeromicrobium stalagmiti]NRQ50398.1 hypothetical protein [Aeromicrobium stalagmiti]